MTIDQKKLVIREVILPAWPGIAGKRVKAVLITDLEAAEHRGTWKWDDHYGEWSCSECGKICTGYASEADEKGNEKIFLPEYCSRCGAQMYEIDTAVGRTMSRPKYYWDDYVKQSLRRYPDKLERFGTEQSKRLLAAIKEAIEETRNIPFDGELRVRAVNMLLIKRTHTPEGCAMVLNISPRTAQRWQQDFVYLVAKKIGLL